MSEPGNTPPPEQDAEALDRARLERAWELRFAGVLTQPAPLTRWLVFSLFGIFILVHLVALPLHFGALGNEEYRFFFVLLLVGAKVNPLVEAGELWRLFAAIWLHASLLHLFLNAMALHYLGRMVENIFGPRAFVSLFLASGLMGSICSYLFSDAPSVGASGAVFGLLGAAAGYGITNRSRIPQRLKRFLVVSPVVWVALNLGLGLLIPNIDMAAHSGGLVLGFVLAPVFGDRILMRPAYLPRKLHRLLRGMLVLGAGISMFFMILRILGQSPEISRNLTLESIGDQQFFVPEGWRKGVLSFDRCASAEASSANQGTPDLSSDICFEDAYHATLFIYPIALFTASGVPEEVGGGDGAPAGFLRVTDKGAPPVYRRKQSDGDEESLLIAPARDGHIFALRSWNNMTSSYLPLMKELVKKNAQPLQ